MEIVALVGWVACMWLSGWLAGEKNRSVYSWIFIALLVGPLALVTLVGAPIKIDDG